MKSVWKHSVPKSELQNSLQWKYYFDHIQKKHAYNTHHLKVHVQGELKIDSTAMVDS